MNHDPIGGQADHAARGDTGARGGPGAFRRTLDKPHACLTLDSAGRVFATLDGQRRCLFQNVAGKALYRFANGSKQHVDATIGTVEVRDNQIILTLSL